MPPPSRDEAWDLFCEWTESESLRRHVRGVELAMRAYAVKYGEDQELWAATGILHGLDYERHPAGPPRETPLAKTLFAVDELTGFIAAVALVRPDGIAGMTPRSVKKLKQPSFAAAVDRDEVRRGAEDLGEDFDEHLAFVIAALEPHAEELGLSGSDS